LARGGHSGQSGHPSGGEPVPSEAVASGAAHFAIGSNRSGSALSGRLGDCATGIDHSMRSLDLVLGRRRPTLGRGYTDALPVGLTILLVNCLLPISSPHGSSGLSAFVDTRSRMPSILSCKPYILFPAVIDASTRSCLSHRWWINIGVLNRPDQGRLSRWQVHGKCIPSLLR
jgi:hypothetical protein